MKKSLYIVLGILCILILSSGVLAFRSAMTGSSFFNINAQESFNFADITDSCTMHTNINLSNPDYCIVGESEAFVSFDLLFNWSMLCCDFSSQCTDNSYTNTSEICESSTNGTYTGYLYNNNGFWLAYCCDENGANCYVDTAVDPNNSATTCDQSYILNTFSLNFNSTWDAVCYAGGIE